MSTDPASQAAVFTDPTLLDQTRLAEVEGRRARGWMLPWILVGYLVLLGTSIAVPVLIVPRLTTQNVQDIQDLMLTVSGLSQGLFGVLGVVVGYYFRHGDSQAEPPPGA